MARKLEFIINDIKECFDGMKKLEAIDWRIVNNQVYGDKTIAILLQHIINWRIFVIKKLQGDAFYDIIIDTLNDWTPQQVNNEQEWQLMLLKIRDTQKEILEQLANRSDDLLDELVPGKKYTFGPILQSVSQHDIYHLGQIAMLNSGRFN